MGNARTLTRSSVPPSPHKLKRNTHTYIAAPRGRLVVAVVLLVLVELVLVFILVLLVVVVVMADMVYHFDIGDKTGHVTLRLSRARQNTPLNEHEA